MGDHDAGDAARLALRAHARRRQSERVAVDERGERLQELATIDRTAPQLEIDRHVGCDRRGRVERADVLRVGVDDRAEAVDVATVAERLDTARGRAGADRDEQVRFPADLVDPLGVVRGGDRPLDERHVVRPGDHRRGGLREVGDRDSSGDGEQLVLAVQEAELAAVARRELPDRQRRGRPAVDALGPVDRCRAELVLHRGPPQRSLTVMASATAG